ncbi:MAG TPA: hypothetical protein VJ505_07785 [Holophagaceae bacterium]|nr:hypothetical protein [Holophagaceae bacterium]
MSRKSPHLEEPDEIRMAFQRLCEAQGAVELQLDNLKANFPVLAEGPGRVVLGISDVTRGQWKLKPGARLTLHMQDRGIPYEATVEFQGHGRLEGEEACHIGLPRLLRALEEHRLAEYVPGRGLPCTFSTQSQDILRGSAVSFGEEGIELEPPDEKVSLPERLRLNAKTHLELHHEKDGTLVLAAKVAYYREKVWGLRFTEDTDPRVLGLYRTWLMGARRHQMQRDRERFDPKGRSAPKAAPEAPKLGTQATLLADKDPVVLVLSEGDALPKRMAEALGRKLGIAVLDYVKGPVKPTLAALGAGEAGWGRVKLIVVSTKLRLASPLEVVKQLAGPEACPLPMLICGPEEDAEVRRNRAIAAGAVDYVVVEPFHVLKVMKALEDTIRMFG